MLSSVDVVGTSKLGKIKISAMILEHGMEAIDFGGL